MANEPSTVESAETALVHPAAMFEDEPPVEAAPTETVDPETQATEVQPTDQPEGQQPPAETTEAETTEDQPLGYEDLLPSKQAKTYPDELYSLAAKKFGVPAEQINEWLAVDHNRAILKSKIDSDIFIEQGRREEELQARAAQHEEPKPAEVAETKPAEEAPKAQVYTFPQIAENAQAVSKALVTDEGAEFVGPMLFNNFRSYQEALDSEDPAKIKAANRSLTEAFMTLGVMLQAELAPRIIPGMVQPLLDQTREGIKTEFAQTRQAEEKEVEVYTDAREMLAREPEYRDIERMLLTPKGEMTEELQAVLDEFPDLLTTQFKDRTTGNPLGELENAMAQYRFAVRQIRGMTQPQVETLVRQATETGRRQERKQNQTTDLGRLAPGRPSGRIQPAEAQDGGDEMQDMVDAMNRANPMSPHLLNPPGR